ncbi:uncharacterized protein [Epargyreus clarus]|uniref:uncharacterized protein n=1 Tax=Epargyreus clarus TaxID=520877 RepID=UPI003C30C269
MTDVLSPKPNMEIENSFNNVPSNSDHLTSTDKKSSDSEDDNEVSFTRIRTKLKQFTDSDTDTDKDVNKKSSSQKSSSDESSNAQIFTYKKKSRIKSVANSESDSEQGEIDHKEPLSTSNNYDLTRTKIKNKKLQDKFKKLKNPTKSSVTEIVDEAPSDSDADKPSKESECSDAEISCLNIKQKYSKKPSVNLSSICDPDASDEESNINKSKPQKSKPRSTKLTSPKAVRMSAKQAMENMHKIKSESNRMLREKEVSLPYHRPRALNLKDIMSRRRPAVTSDGKSLPIKMNNEQLQQYALLLEQRQKEMIELCKSDTEEDEENCPEENSANDVQKIENADMNEKEIDSEINPNKEDVDSPLDISDKLYDDLSTEITNKINENVDEKVIEESTVVNESKPENSSEPTHENDTITKAREEEAMDVDSEPCEDTSTSIPVNKNTEEDSEVVTLHYETEKTESLDIQDKKQEDIVDKIDEAISEEEKKDDSIDDFSENDFTMDDLDKIIEKAEIMNDKLSKLPIKIDATLEIKPKLTGAPGTFIDLDDDSSNSQKKLTGVELLKERYTYFAKLQSKEDMEKDREKKFKPGTQHLKLKQALEEQIAEQRSLEWEKRLELENQMKAEVNTLDEGEGFDGEDIEKIEAKLEENDNIDDEESSSEEELEENDCDLKEKPRKRNPMVDDEAEVSDDDDVDDANTEACNEGDAEDNDCEGEDDEAENDSDSDEDDSESDEDETESKPKKGRILKAFEDSDDEDLKVDPVAQVDNQDIQESQDYEIQLGQLQKSYSEDLFSSQAYSEKSSTTEKPKDIDTSLENDLGCQTFSILQSGTENEYSQKDVTLEKIDVICETQPCSGENFDAIAGMCTGGFLENLVTPQESSTQLSQSQDIGDDVAALCTGKFYDNPFLSQTEENGVNAENYIADESIVSENQTDDNMSETPKDNANTTQSNEGENKLLKSILDELGDPEFDSPKPNKYFFSGNKEDSDKHNIDNTQLKKKFVIESDDETNEGAEVMKKKKKRKKRKLEDRALQISDDEEEEYSEQEGEEYESDIEEDNDKLVEYDSEENEVEIQIQTKVPKKKRVGKDFFEQEAELTSEDEWIGSGDEDEAGLDRMEREAGDDDTFHQGKLQRELGEIHMREVLDQDKREVRLLQELLFEDGDLGDGHRQRKFRWKNADGEEEMGTNADEYVDTQEDEFESEEQWRKQRHEREMFLRKMQEKDDEDANVSINRSAFIKANLCSKTSSVPEKSSVVEKPKTIETEKKTASDIPSPKKPFTIFQSNYHNSLLTRGRGALARLAALATPLAGDGDDGPKVKASSNRGNFVFATITPDDKEPKVTKRKAEANPDTPRLLKKMKKQEIKDKLFPYAEENVKQFLDSKWDTDDVKKAVGALRELASEDLKKDAERVEAVIPGEKASKEDQIEGLVKNVKWLMSSDRKVAPLKDMQGLIWQQGYDNGDIKGHVYDDVMAALEQWRSGKDKKVYIYSSGSVRAQKLLFGQSLAGDLLPLIDGHFDTEVGAKGDATSYTAIAEKIEVKPGEVLFLTDKTNEAEAARKAGMYAALVSREGNDPLTTADKEAYAVLQTFAQLTVSNKRKTEPQDEQPAKIPKTDTKDDDVMATEPVVEKVATEVVKEQESMDLDEAPVVQEPAMDEDKKASATVETVIEDITDSAETVDVPMLDVEPVITEESENTDTKIEKNGTEEAVIVKPDIVVTKADEVVTKPEEVKAKPDEVVTKPDEVVTKPEVTTKADEAVAKPNEVVTKPVEDATKPDEIVTKPEEVLKKEEPKEVAKATKVSPSTETKDVVEEVKATKDESKTNDTEEKVETAKEPEKEKIEAQVAKEKAKVAEETPPVVIAEIEEITGENLDDVAEMIEDIEPVVEEPENEDMEDLQNVGEVLEKECDEILSKVQDVTNLDNIPLKPLLNPIAEEPMETELDNENMDSNDIVDRILDRELELEMKQCNDIDLNTVSEITDEAKTEQTVDTKISEEKIELETNTKSEEMVTENNKETSEPESMITETSQEDAKVEEKVETNENKDDNDKVESKNEIKADKKESNDKETLKNEESQESPDKEDKASTDKVEKKEEIENNVAEKKETTEKTDKSEEADKMETDKVETQVTNEESKDKADNSKEDAKTQEDTKDTEMTEDSTDKESQVNGKTNGDAKTVNVNGDSKDELSSRLSVENGKDAVNGSNDSVDSEKGQGDVGEVSDIKVKSVASDEPRTDPIEQPTEA